MDTLIRDNIKFNRRRAVEAERNCRELEQELSASGKRAQQQLGDLE
jgi:hypothetical protein